MYVKKIIEKKAEAFSLPKLLIKSNKHGNFENLFQCSSLELPFSEK